MKPIQSEVKSDYNACVKNCSLRYLGDISFLQPIVPVFFVVLDKSDVAGYRKFMCFKKHSSFIVVIVDQPFMWWFKLIFFKELK